MFDSSSAAAPCEASARHDDELGGIALVDRLRSMLLTKGGFTIDFRTAKPLPVGLAVCADPSRTLRFSITAWSDRLVIDWLDHTIEHLHASWPHDRHLGGWCPTGSDDVHLNVVRVLPPDRPDAAETLGRRHRQHALFDLSRRTLVPLAVG